MGRRPCCSKEGLNKGAWTPMEDKILVDYIKVHGEGKWRNLPKKAGLKRCGKSCRLRWLNYLRPDIKRGNITRDEEDLIIRLHKLLGNRWSLIAGRLPGRTDNEIKNYWNTNIGKKLQHERAAANSGHAKSRPPVITQDIVGSGSSLSSSASPCLVVRTKTMRCTKVFIPTTPKNTDHHDDSTTNNNDKHDDDKVMEVESTTLVASSSSSFSLSSILSEQQHVSGSSALTALSGDEFMENNFNFMFNFDMDDPFLSELINAAENTTTIAGDQVGDSFSRNEKERSYFPPNVSQNALFSEETQHNDLELWINGFSS